MKRLIPQFILENHAAGKEHGNFEAATLFIDLSGFTPLTSALMEHGDDGAEVLSGIINTLFDPLIKEIEYAGGFVATFAGDALTAVFPEQEVIRVAHAALRMQRVMDEKHLQYTPAGEFPVEAKIGVGYGTVEWGIVRGQERSTYYVRGDAIDEAAASEHRCESGQVMLGPGTRPTSSGGTSPGESTAEEDTAEDELALIESGDGFARIDPSATAPSDAADSLAHLSTEASTAAGTDAAETLQADYVPVEELPARSEGEFRAVSSVFISFKAPSHHEATADLVRPLVDLAHEYGGYLNLLDFGDKGGIGLVLFGAPTSKGDDLERAADFTIAATAALGDRGRAGLASGTVFAGYVGNQSRSTYTALGTVVNLSARLAMDADWSVAATAGDAAERLESRHTMQELYRRRFKGFDREVPVYTISGVEAVSGITDTAHSETPFVGRTTQLSSIQSAVSQMLTAPMCTHYVLGEAGIGKTRLVRQLAEDQREDVVAIFLEADTILRKSMNALPRFLRAVFEISQIDLNALDGGSAMEQLTDWLEERDVDAEFTEELRRARSGLLALLGQVAADSLYAQLDPQARFELTASAMRALVGAVSSVYPLLIVLDNAHTVDEDTRSIFTRLVTSSPGDHFGVIFVGRGTAGSSPFGIEESVDMDQMTVLRGLTAEEVREIAGNVIQGPVEQSLVDFVIHRVGTNPLYVTELARYLVQHRLISQGESGYRVTTESVSLPTEINALLVARVDALPATIKEAAQAAAILGGEFDPIVLEKLVNAGDDFNEILEQGISAGLWLKTDDGRYRFQQDLVRQAMEEMQLSATLKRLHTRAATLLRQLRPDDPSLNADLAYHYTRADMQDEARTALRNAADYAIENFKNEKALEFLQSYQDYAASIDERIVAYRDMASIYELTGRWSKAMDTLTYGVGLSVITNNLGARARLLSNLGEVYRKQSENKTAIRILEQARQLSQHEKDFSTFAEALIYLGRSHWARGDYGAALAHFDQALQTSTEHDDLKLEGLALYYQGVVYRDQNRFNDADRNFRRSYALFEQIRDDRLSTYPLYDLGVVRLYQGQIAEAKDYFQRALSVYQRIGYESGASAATLNLGVLRDRRGDFKRAIRYYQEAREIAERINEHMAIGYTLFSIGATYYKMGDNRKSLAYLRDAFSTLKRLGAKGYYGYVLSYLVSLFVRTGNADRALQSAYQHTQVVSQIGTDPENGRTVVGLAILLQKQPELSQESQQMLKRVAHYYKLHEITPDSFFRKAIEISEPPTYVDTLIPAHFRYAEFLKQQGDEAGFRSHLKTAFELAVDAHWDRFVRMTRDNYGELLQSMGVNTDVETEDFDLEGTPEESEAPKAQPR